MAGLTWRCSAERFLGELERALAGGLP
jgi:hypothetical protein